MTRSSTRLTALFERFAGAATQFTGSTPALAIAAGAVLLWALLGPVFRYSDTWQLVINTGTTVVTFLMVFLIQRAQNKDSLAIHLKLNELVAAVPGASNHLVVVEDLTEEELDTLERHYRRLAEIAKKERNLRTSHSVDEASNRVLRKKKTRGRRTGLTPVRERSA